MSAWTSGAPVVLAGEHPAAQVRSNHPIAATYRNAGEVPGAAREIKDERAGPKTEGRNGGPAPGLVESERHEPIDQVVARRDGVEHRAHPGRLLRSLWERRFAHRYR